MDLVLFADDTNVLFSHNDLSILTKYDKHEKR